MAIKITDEKHYGDIASAIREKNGESTTYKPSEMAAAILTIAGDGKKVSSVSIYENTDEFAIAYEDGSTVSGNATFDENGLATSLTDENGNAVNFTSGYPTSATGIDGNTVPIIWG